MSFFSDLNTNIGSAARRIFIPDRVTDSQIENQEQLNNRWARIRSEGLIDERTWNEYSERYGIGVTGERLIVNTDTEVGDAVIADAKDTLKIVGDGVNKALSSVLGKTWENLPVSMKILIFAVVALLLFKFLAPKGSNA